MVNVESRGSDDCVSDDYVIDSLGRRRSRHDGTELEKVGHGAARC